MGWFSQGKDVTPTPDEAKILWDEEAPEPGPGAGVLSLRDAFQVPGHGTVFTGWVVSGKFRAGQPVIVQGKSGFARGTVGRIGLGRDEVESVEEGKYVSFNIPNLSVRIEILGLDEGCTITTT